MTYLEQYQQELKDQGFYTGRVDDDFGPKTFNASMEALNEAGIKDNKEGKKALSESPVPTEQASRPLPPLVAHTIEIPSTKRTINEIIWHCAATPEGRSIGKNPADTIDMWHKARGWSGIGYGGVIDLDGKIYLGRDWNEIGAHVKGHNTDTIGFSYVGGVAKDAKTAKDTRTEAQRASMLWLTRAVCAKYPITKISGHNEYAAKACPSFDVASDELGNIPGFVKGHKE